MEGEKPVAGDPSAIQEFPDAGQIGECVRDAWYQGGPDDEIRASCFLEAKEVLEDAFVADAGMLPVSFLIQELQIKENKVQEGEELAGEGVPGEMAAGLEGDVESMAFQGFGQASGFIHRGRRLSSRKRDASAGGGVESSIPQEEFGQLGGAIALSADATGLGRADFGAGSAGSTAFLPLRAGLGAGSAPDASLPVEGDFPVGAHAFGVVAPRAGQRAAFEEHGRPDARAIVHGEAPDLEDQACHTLPVAMSCRRLAMYANL